MSKITAGVLLAFYIAGIGDFNGWWIPGLVLSTVLAAMIQKSLDRAIERMEKYKDAE